MTTKKEIEKEVKILNPSSNIQEVLVQAGCVLCKKEIQENIIFKSPAGNAKLRWTQSLLTNEFTYEIIRKFSVSDKEYKKYKIKMEESISITKEEYIRWIDTLPFLGYNLILKGKKERESYKLGDYLYEIDEWDKHIFPFPYVEMECLNHKKGIVKGLEQVWSKKEIKKLILCTDGIIELRDTYLKSQVDPLLKLLKKK